MSAVIDAGERALVALISREDAARVQLRNALGDFGADVVAEQDATGLNVDALRDSGAKVVIVSLDDAEIDAEMEALQPLLDDPQVSVVFDETSVSSQLSGWDLARWARHLAAKVLGFPDVNPPRPEHAEALGGEDLMPGPGAPPTPEQMAGVPMIEEFTIEAEDHADAVPTDFMPMVAGDTAAASEDDHDLGLDLGGVEQALASVDARAEVAPTSVPDAVPDENPDDPSFVLPEIDFSNLDGELAAGNTADVANPVAMEEASADLSSSVSHQTTDSPAAVDPEEPYEFADSDDLETVADEAIETIEMDGIDLDLDSPDDNQAPAMTPDGDLPDADIGFSLELESDEEGVAETATDTDPFAGTLAGIDLDTDEPVNFSRFDSEADELDFGMDDDVAKLAAQLDEQAERADAPPVTEAPADGAELEADGARESGNTAKAAAGLDFTLEQLSDDELVREPSAAKADAADATDPLSAARAFDFSALELEPLSSHEPVAEDPDTLRRVIVLGASIGGPDALRTFLGGIPKNFPALFLLAQHLESGFFGRLAEQLQKASALPVRVVDAAQPAIPGQVLVVSAERRMSLAKNGKITLTDHEEPPRYQPCIDDVLRNVADMFGKTATAIIFSGMAGDAVEGSVYLTSKGGQVWAQDSESCVVSSMVDGARARGAVEFSGTPRELAAHCVATFGN